MSDLKLSFKDEICSKTILADNDRLSESCSPIFKLPALLRQCLTNDSLVKCADACFVETHTTVSADSSIDCFMDNWGKIVYFWPQSGFFKALESYNS